MTDHIDPHQTAEYPILLGDSLRGDSNANNGLVNINYNWKPKSELASMRSRLKKSGDRYELTVEDRGQGADADPYRYTGSARENQTSGTSMVLVFDKSKNAFVLESLAASLDMNLASGPGFSSKSARGLSQLQNPSQGAAGDKQNQDSKSQSSDNDEPDPSNPYDFRHFLSEARSGVEKSTAQGNGVTQVAGSRTPFSGANSPAPTNSRFLATTPQFQPTTTAKSRKPDPPRGAGRTAPAKSTATKSKTSSQALSKERISDSDLSSPETDESAPKGASRLSPPKSSTSSYKPNPPISRGHNRNVSTASRGSPHIIINDDTGLEIDMGSPPPESRRYASRVNPEAFRSHTGTPNAGHSSNGPQSRAEDKPRSRLGGYGHQDEGAFRDRETTMKDINAATSDEDADEDLDNDVEEFALGSPREKKLPALPSSSLSRLDDEDDEDEEMEDVPAPTPPAPNTIADDDDEEDLLAAELEAALNDEDDEDEGDTYGIGLGIRQDDEESEISEEE